LAFLLNFLNFYFLFYYLQTLRGPVGAHSILDNRARGGAARLLARVANRPRILAPPRPPRFTRSLHSGFMLSHSSRMDWKRAVER